MGHRVEWLSPDVAEVQRRVSLLIHLPDHRPATHTHALITALQNTHRPATHRLITETHTHTHTHT